MLPKSKEPFRFFSRLSLTLLTGLQAKNLEELLRHLKTVPDSVIYHHTHRFLYEHQFLVPEPPNDFADWVSHALLNPRLGERLAAIDTVRFNSIGDLRQALMRSVEEHIKTTRKIQEAPESQEFYFSRAVRFSIPTSYQAYDLQEFAECLKKVSLSSLYLHIFEAKLRPPLGVNDFSCWFETGLGEKRLAFQVANLDPYTQTLEGLRGRIIKMIEKRVEELYHVEA